MEGRKTALGRFWTGENKEKPRYQAKGLHTAVFRWSEWRDLNSRPLDPQSSALPAAPHPDNVVYYTGRFRKMQALFSNFLKKFCKGPSSPQKHWAEGHLLLIYIVAGGAGFAPGRQLGAAPPALLRPLGKEPFLLHQLFQAVRRASSFNSWSSRRSNTSTRPNSSTVRKKVTINQNSRQSTLRR